MLNRYILSVFLMLCLTPSFAQFEVPMQETCEKLIKRKLLVVLFDETNGNNKYNDLLKAEFKSNWKYGEVEFAESMPAMYKKVEADKTGYAVVEFMDDRHSANGWITTEMANVWSNTPHTVTQVEKFTISTFVMQVILPEQSSPFLKVGVQNSKVGPSDIVFWAMQLNVLTAAGLTQTNIFNYKKNLPTVQGKTVYFNENDITESGLKYLEKSLKYPYKVVSNDEYNKIVQAKQEGTYYFKIIYSQEFVYRNAGAVIDAATGRVAIRTSHIAGDCKTTYYGPADGVADSNGPGMCAKHLVSTLYDEKIQAKSFKPELVRNLNAEQ